MSEIPEGCQCSDCHPFSSHQIENAELKRVFEEHQTRTAKRINELEAEVGLRNRLIDSLSLSLDAALHDANIARDKLDVLYAKERRDLFTMAALTGLASYSGNSPINGLNAVRLADEAIAALAMPASND